MLFNMVLYNYSNKQTKKEKMMKIKCEEKMMKKMKNLVKILKIEALEIRVEIKELRSNGKEAMGKATKIEDGIYLVELNENNSKNQNNITLAHEMIHVQQMSSGRLITIEYPNTTKHVEIIWEGKKFDWMSSSYMQYPWEIEAFQNEKRIAQLARK